MRKVLITICLNMLFYFSFCQKVDSLYDVQARITALRSIDTKSIEKLNSYYEKATSEMQNKSESILNTLKKNESELQKRVFKSDSLQAQTLFGSSSAMYDNLLAKLKLDKAEGLPIKSLNNYVPGLDSVLSVSKYLQQINNLQKLDPNALLKIEQLGQQAKELQNRLQTLNEIQTFIKQREDQLKSGLASFSLGNKMLDFNKNVYYYQQQMEELKSVLKDKKELENTVISKVSQLPSFQKYMQKNSWLSQLFPSPGSIDTARTIAGSQTKISVQKELGERFGDLKNVNQYMLNQVKPSQALISGLQSKFTGAGSIGSSSDLTMPDFKPNTEKTKTFWDRMEYSFNVQSQKSNNIFPTTTLFALMAGYKLSNDAIAGIGVSYNVGWGNSINNIHLSTQGIGLRSFLDIKIKGGFWCSGGIEYNYQKDVVKPSMISDFKTWQKSALLGITKKFKVGSHSTSFQLLYDFLSVYQVPRTQPVIYRIGYSL